jgi:hypothetical protein
VWTKKLLVWTKKSIAVYIFPNVFQFIYLFFREDAVEADFQPATYSRVARVCKADRGGPAQHYGQEWTTFVKARLNCSIGGASGAHGRPFYFDQLIAVSPQVHDGLVYATFVSEFDFLRHSVVCAFRLQQIDALFRSGPYLAYDQGQRRWTRRPRDELTAGLGQCQPESEKMSEDEALARRKYPLMADSVPTALGKAAAGIHRGGDHYGQVATGEGITYIHSLHATPSLVNRLPFCPVSDTMPASRMFSTLPPTKGTW